MTKLHGIVNVIHSVLEDLKNGLFEIIFVVLFIPRERKIHKH